MHQMGPNGPRFFVPPNVDPIDTNQDPLIWRTAGLLGGAMALALESQNKSGVISNAMYDYYWPGYEDSAPLGRNTVCVLTEVASARVASPVDVAGQGPARHAARSAGLSSRRSTSRIRGPAAPGGCATSSTTTSSRCAACSGAAARYRDDLLLNFYTMGRRAIARGTDEAPFAYVIPPDQHDSAAAAKLVSLLAEGGVDVLQAQEPFKVGDRRVRRRHGDRADGAAVPRVRQEPARGAALSRDGRTGQQPESRRTTSRAGRCRCRWACGVDSGRIAAFDVPVTSRDRPR